MQYLTYKCDTFLQNDDVINYPRALFEIQMNKSFKHRDENPDGAQMQYELFHNLFHFLIFISMGPC